MAVRLQDSIPMDDFTYRDVNGDGTIDDTNDRTYIGSPHPDFTYGLNFSGDYKGFDIQIFFAGSQGNDVYNYEKIFSDFRYIP